MEALDLQEATEEDMKDESATANLKEGEATPNLEEGEATSNLEEAATASNLEGSTVGPVETTVGPVNLHKPFARFDGRFSSDNYIIIKYII